MKGILWGGAFLFAPFLVFGEVIEVDVGAWADIGTGTVNGWEVNGIGRTADDGLTRVKEIADYARSPEFDFNVTQLVMRVLCTSAETKRFLTITPTISVTEAQKHTAERSAKLTEQIFTWSSSEGVRQFRLQNDAGEGSTSWGIASLAVYTDRIAPPTRMREDALYNDAFAAAWDPAPKAVRYQVRYASVTRKQPSYETVAKWDFSSVTNTHGGNPRTFDLLKKDNPGKLDDLTGTNVCMEKYTGGHVQIGQREKLGFLGFPMSPVPEGLGPLTGILRAWKHPDDSRCPTMPIYLTAGGVTNDLVTLELAIEKTDYRFPIPKDVAIESVVLSSTTNLMTQNESHGRVRVESFAILSDYDPGSVTTNEFKTIATRATAKVVEGLTPGEWVWSVRSFDAKGHDSPWSPFRTVILDSKSRHYPRPCSYLFAR